MRSLIAVLLLSAAFPTFSAKNAILQLECSYPSSDSSGLAKATATFDSTDRSEAITVTYVLTAKALADELSGRVSFSFLKVDDDHYISKGGTATIRNIERRPGLIDNACDEAISILISRFDKRVPVDVLGLPNIELYLLDGLARHRWEFVARQDVDRSTLTRTAVHTKYYFRYIDK